MMFRHTFSDRSFKFRTTMGFILLLLLLIYPGQVTVIVKWKQMDLRFNIRRFATRFLIRVGPLWLLVTSCDLVYKSLVTCWSRSKQTGMDFGCCLWFYTNKRYQKWFQPLPLSFISSVFKKKWRNRPPDGCSYYAGINLSCRSPF